MIIDSTAFKDIPGLISATLTETTDGTPAQLSLTWVAGSGVPEYQEPITIIHRGRVLFHGKATSTTYNNSAGDATVSTTAQNFLWLLDKQTLGDILGNISLQEASRHALSSWENLAASIQATASGWTVNPDGSPKDAEDYIHSTWPGAPEYDYPLSWNRKSPCTAAAGLQKLLQAHPGTLATVDYTTGTILLRTRAQLPAAHLVTTRHHITEISGISANYESMPAGIAVIVEWDLEILHAENSYVLGGDGDAGRAVRIFPPDLPPETLGIRVFTRELHLQSFTGGNHHDDCQEAAEKEADRMLQGLIPWFQEVTTPAVTGDVTTLMSDWEASPLAHRLNICGPGSVDTLDTPVTSVDWDFMALTTTLHLGHAYGEPKLTQLGRAVQEFHPRETSSAEPGDFTFSNRSDESSEDSTEAGSGTWPGTWPGPGTGTGSGGGGTGTGGGGSDGSGGGGSGGGCNCNCQCKAAELMAQIQAAIDQAVSNVRVQVSITQELGTTETGTLYVTGQANADSTSGNSTIDVHY
ncbi:MAG: hypothetical protein Q4E43_05280 [Akkermansia sp.]|nr:hypothetical protein [Akkermansia sp.]